MNESQNKAYQNFFAELNECQFDFQTADCALPLRWSEILLEKVSRTFALNIKVLPTKLKRVVLLAYLFCRIADTIEDDADLSIQDKTNLLELLTEVFKGRTETDVENFCNALPQEWSHTQDWEKFLCIHLKLPFSVLMEEREANITIVSAKVIEMAQGMADFQQKTDEQGHLQLRTMRDLDLYCYFVAGTVGEMLTELFGIQSVLISGSRLETLRKFSVSFGLGLQVTNILKDAKEDWKRGVCWLPQDLLKKHQLTPQNLFLPENEAAAESVIRTLITKTQQHLDDALEYTLNLPRLEPRMRLFCLWPLMMAQATLQEGIRDLGFLKKEKVKITRQQVRSIVKKTSARFWSNTLLKKMYNSL